MITVNDLCFDYPGKRALDHLSFTIEQNTITALVGPNGAGKTTLLRCLAALESPTIGSIVIDGIDTERYPRKIHETVSYLPDLFGLYDNLTVRQCLVFFASSHLCPADSIPERIEKTVEALHLKEYLDVQAGKLSRGLRQRLAIGQTIIHQPKILILDEPASGLDPEARFHLSKLLLALQKSGMTLIVSSHILSELEDYSSDMIVLNEGKLINQSRLFEKDRTQKSTLSLIIEFTEPAERFKNAVQEQSNLTVKSIDGKFMTIAFTGSSDDQHQLLKLLIQKNLPVCGIQEQKESMQDVYMTITKSTANNKE